MKKLLLLVAIAGLISGLSSCKKDKQSGNALEKNYFTIQNATYVNSDFPGASASGAPTITNVYGNTTVLEGGSNPITIISESNVKEVLIGVQGKTGYYKISSSDLKSASITYMVYLLFSSNFTESSFNIIVAIVNDNGSVSSSQTIKVNQITAGTGKLQVSVSWDKLNDLDLHLVQPDSTEIYWNNDESLNGGLLDVDSNADCALDSINNENITYSGDATVQKGDYTVRIALFSKCNISDLTHYVVTVRMDGQIITPTVGKNPFYGSVESTHSWIEGDGPREGVTVMKFNVPSTKSISAEKQKMLKFSYPKRINLEKRDRLMK